MRRIASILFSISMIFSLVLPISAEAGLDYQFLNKEGNFVIEKIKENLYPLRITHYALPITHEESKPLLATIQGNTIIPHRNPETPQKVIARHFVLITAYSSTVDQTDSTPFITASGARVCDGIIAANFLRFGTKVKLPHLFGDKIFVVEDRMHARFPYRVDIWFPERKQALDFGVKRAEMVILL